MGYMPFILPWVMLLLAVGTALAVRMLEIRSKIFIAVASINGLVFIGCAVLIILSASRANHEVAAMEAKLEATDSWKFRHMDEITLALAQLRPLSQSDNLIINKIKEFGWLPTQNAIRKLEQANAAREKLLGEYYPNGQGMFKGLPKVVDNTLVDLALRQIGFTNIPYKQGEDVPENINVLFFGSKLDVRDVKLVALTLMRAGVELRAIKPFPKETQGNLRAIKGEFNKTLDVRRILSVEEIEKAKVFR